MKVSKSGVSENVSTSCSMKIKFFDSDQMEMQHISKISHLNYFQIFIK